jgi:murein DD-endopeptidase MepM/ murein hydrolase activator NlpD
VVAFSAGVVVGINSDWEPGSPVRGGNYVWVFDPQSGRYNYYAHLQRIDVRLGQIVKAGEPLGLLGRTGKNAIMARSPTHLHFMVLAFDAGRMTPYNPWKELVAAQSVQIATR